MKGWKEKIFDDVWKYILGLVGGTTVTGMVKGRIEALPQTFWIVFAAILVLVTVFLFYWGFPSLKARWKKRKMFKYWSGLIQVLLDFKSCQGDEGKKKKLEIEYCKIKNNLDLN